MKINRLSNLLNLLFVLKAPKFALSFLPNPFPLTPFIRQSSACSSDLTSHGMVSSDTSLDQETLKDLLEVATDAAKRAGKIIGDNAGGSKVEKSKANSRDLLTLIDPMCEKVIQDVIAEKFPSHGFLGEESVPPGKEASTAAIEAMLADSANSDFLWIVDPIDGTTNFVHGMPLCAPSVAIAYKGEVVAGAIYDPHRDELFTAMKGYGAMMNGDFIEVGKEVDLSEAIVAMGSPPGEESMEMSMRGVEALMPAVRSIRMIGSAALMLAWVANGRFTCYWEHDLSSWDVSAGALLVREAGGSMTDLEGNEWSLTCRKICGSNGRIHKAILDKLHGAKVI